MEIRLSLTRKSVFNIILGIACIFLLILFAVIPYFDYGDDEIVLSPENGILGLLDGKWVTEKAEGVDGFYSVTIAGKKDVSVEWQNEGVKGASSANYKYSRASKELVINLLNENGETVKQMKCEFNPQLILGGRKIIPLLQYLITPFDYEEMDNDISVNHENYFINQAIIFPLIIMIVLVITVLISFIYHKKTIAPFIAACDSVLAILVYIVNPLLSFGKGQLLHIICFAALLLLSVFIIWRTARPNIKIND